MLAIYCIMKNDLFRISDGGCHSYGVDACGFFLLMVKPCFYVFAFHPYRLLFEFT